MNICSSIFEFFKQAKTQIPSITEKTSVEKIKELYMKYGVPFKEANLFGIRHEENPELDTFNDFLGIATNDIVLLFPGTTDPSVKWTQTPISGVAGAAHICLGYHPGIWVIGIHCADTAFAHEALIQIGNSVKIWRDLNKDYKYENNEPITSGYYGINFHRAHPKDIAQTIGSYSAGCQVLQNAEDLATILNMLKSTTLYQQNNQITWDYMLFDKTQVVGIFE